MILMNTEPNIDCRETQMMTWFLFVGDMLVMLFMVVLVVWVSLRSKENHMNAAALIPLRDERDDD